MSVSQIWPQSAELNNDGELSFYGHSASSLVREYGSPLYLIDTDEVTQRAKRFVEAAQSAFHNTTTHVSFAGKAFLSKEIVRLVTQAGMFVDTCSMGEMRIALAAGVPGRRLVLHGNNKSDEEITLAIEREFAKIVVDEPSEPARIARIAKQLGKRAKVMLRVTAGIHAGGHEYISTAHEDQKFGVSLLPAGADRQVLDVLDNIAGLSPAITNARVTQRSSNNSAQTLEQHLDSAEHKLEYDVKYPFDLDPSNVSDQDKALAHAMQSVADGPALAVLHSILGFSEELELVGIHSHIGSQIHDAQAFIEAAQRMMLLRKTFYATDAYTLPEVDLGGGYSVAYTDTEDSMNIEQELGRLSNAVSSVNRAFGMPAPVISFEPGRWIIAPAGVTLYSVGTIKHVPLPKSVVAAEGTEHRQTIEHHERVYVSVDGGMSDNIRPALYDADYTARLANREGSEDRIFARVVGMHCESGDILVHECELPADVERGDILAVPVTGAYGRTMASNYNQALIPAVVAVNSENAHVMIRRQTIDDLLSLDLG